MSNACSSCCYSLLSRFVKEGITEEHFPIQRHHLTLLNESAVYTHRRLLGRLTKLIERQQVAALGENQLFCDVLSPTSPIRYPHRIPLAFVFSIDEMLSYNLGTTASRAPRIDPIPHNLKHDRDIGLLDQESYEKRYFIFDI